MAGPRARGARRPCARSQHFLRTSALAAQLVRDACVGPDDIALDLGAGTGRLTAELAAVAHRVMAVELDSGLAARLSSRWENVEVVHGDAASFPLPSEPFRVVANLPFSRTADLLRLLLDDPRTPLTRADLIVQWGVAVKRGLPWPSSVSGVVWGATYEAAVARRLPRQAFEPPPAVDAGVLVFRRRPRPLVPADQVANYRFFVATGFRRGLGFVTTRRALARVAEAGAAARDLDAHQWAELFTFAGEARVRDAPRAGRPRQRTRRR